MNAIISEDLPQAAACSFWFLQSLVLSSLLAQHKEGKYGDSRGG